MKQEQIEKIIELEGKRKKLKEDIDCTKRVIANDKSGFMIGKVVFGGRRTYSFLNVSEKIVEMAIEEAEKKLREIERELEEM